jgi:hypothetical protein
MTSLFDVYVSNTAGMPSISRPIQRRADFEATVRDRLMSRANGTWRYGSSRQQKWHFAWRVNRHDLNGAVQTGRVVRPGGYSRWAA